MTICYRANPYDQISFRWQKQECTCFRNSAAVIEPPCLPPVLTISATPDFIDSQQLSSSGSLQNFSPDTSEAAVTSLASSSLGVKIPVRMSLLVCRNIILMLHAQRLRLRVKVEVRAKLLLSLPAMLGPSAITQAPVNVARSIICNRLLQMSQLTQHQQHVD